MPIMAPLASFANVPPELVVTAYQTGNGLVNLVTPTSAVVGWPRDRAVGYGTWLKFVWPLLVILASPVHGGDVGGGPPRMTADENPEVARHGAAIRRDVER